MVAISTTAQAKDCSFTEVKAVQVEKTGALVLLKTSTGSEHWKKITNNTGSFMNAYLSVVQQALATNKSLVLRYPNGYECNKTDYGTIPDMIRILK